MSEHAGRYADALTYADRLLAERLPARMRALLQLRSARALSGLGADTAATDAWRHASHLLTASTADSDPLAGWMHDAEMALHQAVILGRAGQPASVDVARRAVDTLPAGQGRDRVLFQAMHLQIAVAASAWSDVPDVASALLRADTTVSARIPEILDQTARAVEGTGVPSAVREAVNTAARAASRAAAEKVLHRRGGRLTHR